MAKLDQPGSYQENWRPLLLAAGISAVLVCVIIPLHMEAAGQRDRLV